MREDSSLEGSFDLTTMRLQFILWIYDLTSPSRGLILNVFILAWGLIMASSCSKSLGTVDPQLFRHSCTSPPPPLLRTRVISQPPFPVPLFHRKKTQVIEKKQGSFKSAETLKLTFFKHDMYQEVQKKKMLGNEERKFKKILGNEKNFSCNLWSPPGPALHSATWIEAAFKEETQARQAFEIYRIQESKLESPKLLFTSISFWTFPRSPSQN